MPCDRSIPAESRETREATVGFGLLQSFAYLLLLLQLPCGDRVRGVNTCTSHQGTQLFQKLLFAKR